MAEAESWAEYRISSDAGPIVLSVPRALSAAEVADIEEWMAIVLRALKRRAAKVAAPPPRSGSGGKEGQ